MTAVAILAGGLGALARYALGGFVQHRTTSPHPWGTATVNLAGAALLGALVGLRAAGHISDTVLLVGGTGFAGGFTTFSTWMVESVRLAGPGTPRALLAAAVNVVGMLAVGIVVAAATSRAAAVVCLV